MESSAIANSATRSTFDPATLTIPAHKDVVASAIAGSTPLILLGVCGIDIATAGASTLIASVSFEIIIEHPANWLWNAAVQPLTKPIGKTTDYAKRRRKGSYGEGVKRWDAEDLPAIQTTANRASEFLAALHHMPAIRTRYLHHCALLFAIELSLWHNPHGRRTIMQSEKFAYGDAVVFKSGGPTMTVVLVRDLIHVDWFTKNGESRTGAFEPSLLVRAHDSAMKMPPSDGASAFSRKSGEKAAS